jgi:hypothetical protein
MNDNSNNPPVIQPEEEEDGKTIIMKFEVIDEELHNYKSHKSMRILQVIENFKNIHLLIDIFTDNHNNLIIRVVLDGYESVEFPLRQVTAFSPNGTFYISLWVYKNGTGKISLKPTPLSKSKEYKRNFKLTPNQYSIIKFKVFASEGFLQENKEKLQIFFTDLLLFYAAVTSREVISPYPISSFSAIFAKITLLEINNGCLEFVYQAIDKTAQYLLSKKEDIIMLFDSRIGDQYRQKRNLELLSQASLLADKLPDEAKKEFYEEKFHPALNNMIDSITENVTLKISKE